MLESQSQVNHCPEARNRQAKPSIEGSATIAGERIVHAALPAEDMMQAFAYRHLVPAQEMAVVVAENPRPFASNTIKILSTTPVKIPAGGTALVRVATPSSAFVERFDLEVNAAPEGITIQNVSPATNGVEIALHCDAEKHKAGTTGNLIINILPQNSADCTICASSRESAPQPGWNVFCHTL